MTDSLFSETLNTLSADLPDAGELGAMTLDVSINGESFCLIYRALDEVFDHARQQLARNLISFAQQHKCGYALLVGSSCWIAEGRGISIAAQFENSSEIKNYKLIVLPLDDMIYLATMDNGLLTQEKVYPVNKALEVLLAYEDEQQIAILAGGIAGSKLQQAGLDINCAMPIVTKGREAKPYTYQPLNRLLWQHRLYHHRLLIPASAVVVLLLGLSVLVYYYTLEEVQVVATQKFEQVQEAFVPPPPPDYLNNHASQVLLQLRPWLQSPWLDFLTSCRLTGMTISNIKLTYQGQWMDNLQPDRQGCGNARLQQVVQDNRLQLTKHNNGWHIYGIELPVATASRPRPATKQTLQQLEMLALYLGWQLTVKGTKRHGEERDIQLNITGNSLSLPMLAMLIDQLSTLPAHLQQARLEFNPDSLQMVKAELDIKIFTTGEEGP